ncbi:MAG: flagellar biosynthetic protein FliO [Colwellia sp.]
MIRLAVATITVGTVLLSNMSIAQEVITKSIVEKTAAKEIITKDAPEVGKHVMANMDAGSMILSLLMVLALIIIAALVLKRFKFIQQGNNNSLKVVASLSLGAKERVVVIQAGKQQLMLGVSAGKITLIDKLDEPLIEKNTITAELNGSVLSFLKQKTKNKKQ